MSLFIVNINIAGPGVGPSLCMNFFSLPSSLHELFFLAFSVASFFSHPSHHFSNGPSLRTLIWMGLAEKKNGTQRGALIRKGRYSIKFAKRFARKRGTS